RESGGAAYDAGAALLRLQRARGGAPAGIGQFGQSPDGRMPPPTGASKYINGTAGPRHRHRLRAGSDAVVIGVGTAVADDPRLTVRHVEGPSPARVVIDPNGRMPQGLGLLGDGAAPVIAVTRPGVTPPQGAEALALPCD